MYLRQSNKWKELLLAESSQPAVLLTEITYASAVNNLGSKKIKKKVYQWLDAGGWITEPPVPGTHGMKYDSWALWPDFVKNRVVDAYTKRFKQELLRLVPHDLEDNQKGLALTWLNREARNDPNFFGLVIIGGTTTAMGEMDMAYEDSYAHYCVHHFNQDGMIRERSRLTAWLDR